MPRRRSEGADPDYADGSQLLSLSSLYTTKSITERPVCVIQIILSTTNKADSTGQRNLIQRHKSGLEVTKCIDLDQMD